jgi:hypothetical protein
MQGYALERQSIYNVLEVTHKLLIYDNWAKIKEGAWQSHTPS